MKRRSRKNFDAFHLQEVYVAWMLMKYPHSGGILAKCIVANPCAKFMYHTMATCHHPLGKMMKAYSTKQGRNSEPDVRNTVNTRLYKEVLAWKLTCRGKLATQRVQKTRTEQAAGCDVACVTSFYRAHWVQLAKSRGSCPKDGA